MYEATIIGLGVLVGGIVLDAWRLWFVALRACARWMPDLYAAPIRFSLGRGPYVDCPGARDDALGFSWDVWRDMMQPPSTSDDPNRLRARRAMIRFMWHIAALLAVFAEMVAVSAASGHVRVR